MDYTHFCVDCSEKSAEWVANPDYPLCLGYGMKLLVCESCLQKNYLKCYACGFFKAANDKKTYNRQKIPLQRLGRPRVDTERWDSKYFSGLCENHHWSIFSIQDPPPPPPPPPQMPPPPQHQDRPLGGRQLGSSFRSNNMGDGPSERDTTSIQVHVKLEKEFANKSPAYIQQLFDVNGGECVHEYQNTSTLRRIGGRMHSNYDGWEVDCILATGYIGAVYWFFGPVLRCDADDFAHVLCARAKHLFNVEFSPYIDTFGRLGVSAITRPVPSQPSKNYEKNAKKRAKKKAKALAVPSTPPAYDESVDPPAYNSTCPQRD